MAIKLYNANCRETLGTTKKYIALFFEENMYGCKIDNISQETNRDFRSFVGNLFRRIDTLQKNIAKNDGIFREVFIWFAQ